jgi:hypothetical protein
MTEILGVFLKWLFFIAVGGVIFLTPSIFIWFYLNDERRERFLERHMRISILVFFGMWGIVGCALSQGFEKFLFFIPGDWRSFRDGELVTTKSVIADGFSLALICFFIYIFVKLEKMLEENNRLKMHEKILKLKDGLRHDERNHLVKKLEEAAADLEKLLTRKYKEGLSSNEEREIIILSKFIEELEYRIGKFDRDNRHD